MADSLAERFVGSHFEEKWWIEFNMSANNEAFIEHLSEVDDTPEQIYKVLAYQLYEYVERTPVVPRWGAEIDRANVYDKWLNHTRFVCQNAYNKTQNEVYAEAVKWVVADIENREKHTKWVEEQKRKTAARSFTTEKTIISPAQQATPRTAKKVVRPFLQLLTDSFSEKELERLLVHLRMKNNSGENIWPHEKRSGLHGLLDALNSKKKTIKTSRAELMASLSTYLGFENTRVKNGYSAIQADVQKDAISFLNQPVNPNRREH